MCGAEGGGICILLKCTAYTKPLSKFLCEVLFGDGREGICMCVYFLQMPLPPLPYNASSENSGNGFLVHFNRMQMASPSAPHNAIRFINQVSLSFRVDSEPVDEDPIRLVVHLAADVVADRRQKREVAELAEIGS